MSACVSFISALARKKYIDQNAVTETQLARCLSTLDLTALGKRCAYFYSFMFLEVFYCKF